MPGATAVEPSGMRCGVREGRTPDRERQSKRSPRSFAVACFGSITRFSEAIARGGPERYGLPGAAEGRTL